MTELFYVIAGACAVIAVLCAVIAVEERKSCKEMEKRMRKQKEENDG